MHGVALGVCAFGRPGRGSLVLDETGLKYISIRPNEKKLPDTTRISPPFEL